MKDSRLNTIFGTMAEGVLIIQKGGIVEYMNPSARRILSVDTDIKAVTSLLESLVQYEINDKFIDLIVNAVSQEGEMQQALVSYRTQGDTEAASHVKKLEVKTSYTTDEEPSVLLIITDVTKREESYSNCRDSGVMIAIFLGLLFVYTGALALWPTFLKGGPKALPFTWAGLAIGTIACLISYRFTSLSFSKSGMRLSNLKSGILMALRFIPAVVILFIVAKLVVVRFFPNTFPANAPFFNWTRFVPGKITLGHMLYPFSVLAQEFIARVFVHENIARIFEIYGKRKAGIAAIILSSFLFACVHMHQGFYYMLGAFLLSVILGVFYYRTSNFWFIVFVHIIVGDIAVSLVAFG